MSVVSYQLFKFGVINHLWQPDTNMQRMRFQAEGLALFAFSIARAKTFGDAAIAGINFLRSFTGSVAVSEKVYALVVQSRVKRSLKLQGGAFESVSDAYHEMKNMPITTELRTLAAQMLALGYFSAVGISVPDALQQELRTDFSKVSLSPSELVSSLLKLAARLEKAVRVYAQTGKLDGFLHTSDSYAKFYRQYKEVSDRVRDYDLGSDDDVGAISQVVDGVYTDALEIKTRNLRSSVPGARYMLSTCDEAIEFCRKFQLDVAMSVSRTPPFGILIYSPPRRGKSTLIDLMHQSFGRRFGKPTHSATKYNRGGQKYWDGFKTSHWCIVMDDLASENPKKQQGIPEQMKDILQIVNAVPFSPEQADVKDKGTRLCMADLVIGTTNTKDLNSYAYFSTPEAIHRRFPYVVTPTVKPEFAGGDGGLDASKTDGSMDYWTFDVRYYTDSQAQTFGSVGSMLAFLWDKASIERNSGSTIRIQKKSWAESLCSHGLPLQDCEECGDITLQAATTPSTLWDRYTRYVSANVRQTFNLIPKRDEMEALFWSLGRRIENETFLGPTWQSLTIVAALATTAAVTYNLVGRFKHQGEIGSKPEPKGEAESYWKQSVDVLTPLAPDAARCATYEALKERIKANTYRITVSYEGAQNQTGVMVGIGGNRYCINKHIVSRGKMLHVKQVKTSAGSQPISLDGISVVSLPKYDLAIICLDHLPLRKSLWNYIPEDLLSTVKGEVLYPELDHFEDYVFKSAGIKFEKRLGLEGYQGRMNIETFGGLCGSPLVSKHGSYNLFCGIHTAGAGPHAISTPVTLAILREMGVEKEAFRPTTLGIDFQGGPEKPQLMDLHWKSNVRFHQSNICEVYGSLSGFRSNGKSRVGPSLGAEAIYQERGIISDFHPPIMKGWRPWHLALEPMISAKPVFSQADLNWAVEDYVSGFEGADFSDLMIYDLETAINGVPGLKFVDGINRKSSMGFPWRTTKRKYLVEQETNTLPDGVTFTPDVLERIQKIEAKYIAGETVSPVFVASLKDEPVSRKKHVQGKTRVFCAAPTDWTIVVRKFTLCFCRFFQMNWRRAELAIGVTAQGPQWEDLYNYLTEFGLDRIIAGDYRHFDKSMPPDVMIAAFRCLQLIAAMGSCSSIHIQVIGCIGQDTSFPLVDFNGDLVRLFGTNPSGHALTTVINSIVNSLYMRMAYRNITGRTFFRADVKLLTYGDDNILNVVATLLHFNHSTIQAYFQSVGITYTMADKEAESVPYISIYDAEFLKRKWLPSPIGMLAPLREESIWKMLCVVVESRDISRDEQYYAIVQSANMEWFFHGEDRFEKEHKYLLHLVEECDLMYLYQEQPLKTWKQLCKMFFPAASVLSSEPNEDSVGQLHHEMELDSIIDWQGPPLIAPASTGTPIQGSTTSDVQTESSQPGTIGLPSGQEKTTC
jgi:hypothetical protein